VDDLSQGKKIEEEEEEEEMLVPCNSASHLFHQIGGVIGRKILYVVKVIYNAIKRGRI
jgi:hypothetical protein